MLSVLWKVSHTSLFHDLNYKIFQYSSTQNIFGHRRSLWCQRITQWFSYETTSYLCCRVDEVFPNVTFHFENSVFLRVYPHDYLFPYVRIFTLSGWFFALVIFVLQPDFALNLTISISPRTHNTKISQEGMWCIGWQNSAMQSRDRRNMTLLGGTLIG